MSLRPSTRTDVRKKGYKTGVDAEEARRRREDNLVEIRKNKREDSLLKKRREGLLLQSQQQLLDVTQNSATAEKRGTFSSSSIDDWKKKLAMFLRDKGKQELLSSEKKDRRNFEQLADLASKMGLYSHHYPKVVVFSKVPLPNYRLDLDNKGPQREDQGKPF